MAVNALEPVKRALVSIWDSFDAGRRFVRKHWKTVEKINALEPEMRRLADAGKLADWTRAKVEGAKTKEDLDEVLVPVFAAVREAARRTVGMRPFDVQLIGAIAIHDGKIAEMKTGEGKTLVATMPIVLNAFLGRGVHLITHNDYLVKRDAEWMGPIYEYFGLTVGIIQAGMDAEERRAAYACDITYATNSEVGFDYLRDNMAMTPEELVLRELYYAIIDEVDSLIIDEARTPLIISGRRTASSDLYRQIDALVRKMRKDVHYTVDEKQRQVALTDEGVALVERERGISNLSEHVELVHHVNCALKAHALFKNGVDYVVRNGQVIIVDEFTGRLMYGRRYSEGLHQAIEAKERVEVQHESQTIATITFQNFFRLYERLAGMTGTAKTEELEFRNIYGMSVVEVPTNLPVIRKDYPDVIYKTQEAKYRGILLEIIQKHAIGQPVLVGTRSVEVSEHLASRLTARMLQTLCMTRLLQERLDQRRSEFSREEREEIQATLNRKLEQIRPADIKRLAKKLGIPEDPLHKANIRRIAQMLGIEEHQEKLRRILSDGIRHNRLNAKNHFREAEIIAEAGAIGAVTIATNMAGRGVDIQLGGAPKRHRDTKKDYEKVKALGGLHIIGTERHESRRIDNQLRGRAGRQGDPGSSRFYVSLEDELWRLFGFHDRFKGLQKSWPEHEPIEHPLLSKLIERAQKRVEEHHYEIRKHVLKYDDVMNTQRSVIYESRRKILLGADVSETIRDFIRQTVGNVVQAHCDPHVPADEWDVKGMYEELRTVFPVQRYLSVEELQEIGNADELREKVEETALKAYADREASLREQGHDPRALERSIMLYVINDLWTEHLAAMDNLREGIHLRAHAQVDPLVAYQQEAFAMFEQLKANIAETVTRNLFAVRVVERRPAAIRDIQLRRGEDISALGREGAVPATDVRGPTVGRNDPCPCGSGKKYKHCCLKKEREAQRSRIAAR